MLAHQVKSRKLSTTNSIILAAMAVAFFSFCGPAPTATPLPTSMPVEELYSIYQNMRAQNATRVERHKDVGTSSVFEGRITDIKGSTVQFHIARRILEPDKYVECKFKRENDVLNLNVGSVVRLLGDLEDVNGVVQFKNCRTVN